MYQAGCLCGQVELQIIGKINDIIHCHCSLCRKPIVTAYATNGFVNTYELNVVKEAENMKYFKLDVNVIFVRTVHHLCLVPMTTYQTNSDYD
ncbi:hypothetical protein FX995_05910 [Pseudoalteromonas flavipulchra]|nr:hypothetical protein [Pseudoalteromonas flavipulchra]MBE0373372.1 hypothetical protein [Pseudoalteromonas flavipulchra NCIMB 2033 = ATCC BAA-314]